MTTSLPSPSGPSPAGREIGHRGRELERGALRETSPDQGLPVVRAAVRRVLARLFGGPPFDPSADPGDPGLTGPRSASWQVIGEPAAIAGGIRGLLVQVAHPLAMAGVHDHSAFREDPLGRLQRTSAYVTTTTFGSTREALLISQRVRAVHPRVHGIAPDGRGYRADDPRLLAWVSIALTSSFLVAHRRWAPRPVDEDAFVREQSRIGALLDTRVDVHGLLHDTAAQEELRNGRLALPMIEDGSLPQTAAGLDEAVADYHDELGINHQGREALAFLRRPPIPLVARAGYRSLLTGALGSLTPPLQVALDLRWSAAMSAAAVGQAGATLRVMRLSVGTSPSMRAAEARAAR